MPPSSFQVSIPQSKLDTIRQQLQCASVGYAPDDDRSWKYGTDARYLAEFRDYWLDRYDWRKAEAQLNRFPQFKAPIEDLDVHFYHVRGQGTNCFPLILPTAGPGRFTNSSKSSNL